MRAVANNNINGLRGVQLHEKRTFNKVLFVAPSSSGQLQIARYFWCFYRPESYEAEFATLDNAAINPWMNKSMADFGYRIGRNQVSSVFALSTICKDFDCIVSLEGFQSYSTISPFMETLKILFGSAPERLCWDIPDPESLTGSAEEMFQTAVDIRNRIEFEIAQFSRSLEAAE